LAKNRIISSTTANIILDPFSGSGTTAIVARRLKRNYIGIELSPDYCQASLVRLEKNGGEDESAFSHTPSLFGEKY